MKNRWYLYLGFPLVLIAFMSYSFSTEYELSKEDSFVLIQLFTSQGCSSCPSADLLLEKVKSSHIERSVIVLSYHVDYWNRLGWNDPFSKKEYSDLQYEYASKFSSEGVYTPQAVINGSLHFVGSNEKKMNENLRKFLKIPAENKLKVSNINRVQEIVNFEYSASGDISNKYLKAALVIDQRTTKVKRGENGGKNLVNNNIVVQEVDLVFNSLKGKANITIPEIVKPNDNLRIILFTHEESMRITGATQVLVN